MSIARYMQVLAVAAGLAVASGQTLSPVETRIAAAIDASGNEDRALLQKIVDVNSGTLNLAGVQAVRDILQPVIERLGFETHWADMSRQTGRAGDLVAVHPCQAGEGKCGKRLLLIGHLDTVFEPSSPFQHYEVKSDDIHIAIGPGVGDMKGGLVVMLSALHAMQQAGALDAAELRIVLSGDEEAPGTPLSLARHDMIEAARHSDIALEFEGTNPLEGHDRISVGRRSSTSWELKTTGSTGHSSQIFSDTMGYGAIYEMTRIVDEFRRELPEQGLTFNVGLVAGGTRSDVTGAEATAAGKSNIIAPLATAEGDMRTVSEEQTTRVQARMQAIVARHLPRTGATITFRESYPAMAATAANRGLFQQFQRASMDLKLGEIGEANILSRGAGDIAFVAPYVPGLVGVGLESDGAHAPGEFAYLDSLPRQAKRNAIFMYRITKH